MVYLFVDANIYIGSGYVFNNDFFSAVEKYSLDVYKRQGDYGRA